MSFIDESALERIRGEAADEMTILAALREEVERLDPLAQVEVSGSAGKEQIRIERGAGETGTVSLHNLWKQLRGASGEAAAEAVERFARMCAHDFSSLDSLAETTNVMPLVLDRAKSPSATRDQAILLVGLAGGFRRSEISALRVEDIRFVEEGMIALLRRSKTDQEGEGHKVAIPYGENLETCPVRNLKQWIELLKEEEGPLFCQIDRHGNLKDGGLTGQAITRMIKKRVQVAGLDPEPYSGHSLRAGFVTAASVGGAPDHKIMAQTDHRSLTTLFRYKRDADLFNNNAAMYLGL